MYQRALEDVQLSIEADIHRLQGTVKTDHADVQINTIFVEIVPLFLSCFVIGKPAKADLKLWCVNLQRFFLGHQNAVRNVPNFNVRQQIKKHTLWDWAKQSWAKQSV